MLRCILAQTHYNIFLLLQVAAGGICCRMINITYTKILSLFFSQVAEVISKKIIDKIRRSDIVICGKAESYVAVP